MRLFNIALAVIALIGGLEVAWAEKRVALVIGNSSYQRVARLPNPNNDAADMAALLSKVGFKVSRKIDLDHTAFRKALQEFGREAEGADFAIIFFAGHGVEVENRNFLVPTDVSLSADSDVEFEAIPLDLVMNALSRVSGVRVVLLDACRDNPFITAMRRSNATRSIGRGLAAIEPAAGTLVGYAAKEGTTAFDGAGRNSPYTAGLLAHLGEPGVDIQFVFRKVRDTVLAATGGKQEPFTYGSLPGREIFIAPPRGATAVSPANNSSRDASLTEIELWTSIRGSKSSGALKDYLQLYPDGLFVPLARLQIQQLENADHQSGASQEDAPNELAKRIQRELGRVGCNPGNPDGIWGGRTREALRRFARYSGAEIDMAKPTTIALKKLEGSTARVCPAVARPKSIEEPRHANNPNTRPRPTTEQKRAAAAPSASRPARVCRAETRDECRVRARAAGARRGSGFCRNPITICE
ncbi:caspase family protein [Mesorhizobium sp.]|uniref:caspase family protein n=1 Tax=Mesorhizobium sp. TaxID=1871066 RepID=UPI001207B715|nr:caspase family protein [Mesorhizobium sp.]TIL29418.1 MAG: hypothetical protein E5Y85_28015 [Mesorhizobium sp.]TIL49691.1 MAG: hypothetical protein E5Y83_25360 [Mesorhizobium sp.]